jgi:PiT family inorganic phosphate transporter
MGKRITTMNTGQGLLANVVASSLVIGASLAGFPVSTTHVSTGAIFGISLWTGQSNRMVVAGIVASWVITLPMAAVLAYTVAAAW